MCTSCLPNQNNQRWCLENFFLDFVSPLKVMSYFFNFDFAGL